MAINNQKNNNLKIFRMIKIIKIEMQMKMKKKKKIMKNIKMEKEMMEIWKKMEKMMKNQII